MQASTSESSPAVRSAASVTDAVVRAVAAVDDVDPIALSPPAFHFVDPDALESLFESAPPQSNLAVSFEAWDHDVRVERNGAVVVDGRPFQWLPADEADEPAEVEA